MSDPRTSSAYPEPPKYAAAGSWPPPGQVQQPYMQPETQVQFIQQPYMQSGAQMQYVQQVGLVDPSIASIHDWLAWSIINIFVGWLLGGILPLIFSLICRSNKQANNAQGARTMSTLALIFNILATLGGVAGWIGLIVSIILIRSAVCSIYDPYCR